MKEHPSADRLFAGSVIPLPSMSPEELNEIVGIAEREIDSFITFSQEARNRLVSLAQGHPYMVHLIGRYALRHAYNGDRDLVTDQDVDSILRSWPKGKQIQYWRGDTERRLPHHLNEKQFFDRSQRPRMPRGKYGLR